MPDYLMGEFNGGCTTADGCREQPLLAAILQEANAPDNPRRRSTNALTTTDSGAAVGLMRLLGRPACECTHAYSAGVPCSRFAHERCSSASVE